MKPVLEVRDLTFQRGKSQILRGVSWTVRKGEHWVIVGPNGCGKTTLLRTLTGYLSATSGSLSLLGKRYGETDWRELRTRVGLVTSALQQSIPLAEPALETVISGKYAQLNLWAKTTAADARRAQRHLHHLGVGPLASREWLYLSQGERQRVLIARALMARPKLLILDEPAAGLDPIAREDFLGFLQFLAQQPDSPSLVLVTHHVEEIMPAFTHALLLKSGAVVAAGERARTLTAKLLSETFTRPVRLSAKNGRLNLSVPPARRIESP